MSENSPRKGFLKRLRERLNKGDSWLTYDLANLLPAGKIDESTLEELETRLVMADVGIETTGKLLEDLRGRLARKQRDDAEALIENLRAVLIESLSSVEAPLTMTPADQPFVVLMVGVNGAGKTTTLGKLARRYQDAGQSVLLAAGDTFRAAAIEQLQVWGARNSVDVVASKTGDDPAAVLFDAIARAKARNIDVVLADTAGRLQSQEGLMAELEKVKRVVAKALPGAPHEVMLVLDAGLGQNALTQAEEFHKALGLTGITMTKLDGSAKGGIVLAIAERLSIPIRFIGIGEQREDLQPFHAEEFADALLAQESNWTP